MVNEKEVNRSDQFLLVCKGVPLTFVLLLQIFDLSVWTMWAVLD